MIQGQQAELTLRAYLDPNDPMVGDRFRGFNNGMGATVQKQGRSADGTVAYKI